MNKKMIGLICIFILIEIGCYIMWKIHWDLITPPIWCDQPHIIPDHYPDAESCLNYYNTQVSAYITEKVQPWVNAMIITGSIFVILLIFGYFQKKKKKSAFPLETRGTVQ